MLENNRCCITDIELDEPANEITERLHVTDVGNIYVKSDETECDDTATVVIMVDLAKQAFNSKNFDLAAEIYERSICEHGPSKDLLLGLADSLSKSGQFDKAFTVYSKAYRHGQIEPKDLKHLVFALVNTVKQDITFNSEMDKGVIFECLICRNILNDSVTIPCGHSFCRACLQKDSTKQCKNCRTVHHYMNTSKIKSNILLSSVIEKWFPAHSKAVELKRRANQHFQRCNYEEAISIYSEAIQFAEKDHILWSNRSHAYASLDRFKEAYSDAEMVLNLRPDWPKGYFRKGCALYGLAKYEESVVALLQCLALDSSIETAKDFLSKALHNILSPLSPNDPKSAELQRQLNPSLLDSLIRSNFDSSLLLPCITVDTVRQLKDIISNTVATATTFLEGRQEAGIQASGQQAIQKSDNDQQIGSNQQEISNARCLSLPNLRSESPVTVFRRTPSETMMSDYLTNNNQALDTDIVMGNNTDTVQQEEKQTNLSSDNIPKIDASLLIKDDFECSLCYRLLHAPVTPPCGHTFCRQCLDRCLDHKTECPLCKTCLAEYLADRRQTVTSSIQNLLEVYFPEEHENRAVQHDEEMAELASMGADTQREIPVFVCTTAFPSVPCPLHIFEPKYRLMVRQCMESGSRQFGMCVSTGDGPTDFSDYGCMLEVRDVQFFPDGRSLVDTVGGRRFKVTGRGQRDGYSTAKVEFVEDSPLENMEEVQALSARMYKDARTMVESLPAQQKQQIRQHLGEFPDQELNVNFGNNGTTWHWWMMAMLPVDPRIQLAMLAMTSYSERLNGLKRIMGYLKQKRDSR